MKKNHRSGYIIQTAVIYYEEIKQYSPGVIIINNEGIESNRIAPNSGMCNTKEEAELKSLNIGKLILGNHLSKKEIIYF